MKGHQLYLRYLQVLLVIVLVLGVVFRFVNLERKAYWIDEVHTSVRVAGYKKTEFVDKVPAERVIKIEELLEFQRITPEKDWSDTMKALAGNAEHTPLYYVMARLAMQWFGSSVTVTRGLAAVISLLVFPCVYWLCLELFASRLVGWIAMALIAVSPLHVLYAQEAREYSLWTVTILLSSASLLRAMRLKTKLSWGMYALSVAIGLYSHMLSVLVFIGHATYVFAMERFRWSKAFTAYIMASLAGFITLIPWIILYFINASTVGIWTNKRLTFFTLVKRWLVNLSAVFLDLQIGYNNQFFDVENGNDVVQFGYSDLLIYVIPFVVILVGYSLYFICRNQPKSVWLFILTLMGISTIILVVPDVISGGQRSTIGRYLIPCYLGIQLAVAYLLTTQVTSISVKAWQQKLFQLILIALFSSGILSCAMSSQAETWWNKYSSYYNPHVAHIINQSPRPLVISSQERVSRIASLSYQLDSKVRLLLIDGTDISKIPDGFSDVFLFRPSGKLYNKLEESQNYQLQSVHQLGHLWRVQK